MKPITAKPGKPLPQGIDITPDGINFSVFSRHGTRVWIDIFEKPDDAAPYYSYEFHPVLNKTGDLWHVHLDVELGALYLYRVDGPLDLVKGHRFNIYNYLIDPYAKALTHSSVFESLEPYATTPKTHAELALEKQHSAKKFPKCIVIDDTFDWQGDKPLNYPMRHSVLYEMHLKGFTASPSSGTSHPGTYRGLIEKIPYLKDLGVTSIELLPVQEFDENENPRSNPRTGERLTNYWGYSTTAFFAPKSSYASDRTPGACVAEFKEMVREMHKAGLEVILDIVFNHTAEGNEHGATFSFRGFDNSIYYMLENKDKSRYTNYSGCGNTVNCNHPVVRTFIIDCLRYWVIEMHIDGFRFDLGSILGRGSDGSLLSNPPMLERIAEDPVLRNTKIIAEAWDAGGAYQVGVFPGGRWAEWNDRFRDDIRRFWRGDAHTAGAAATRLTGSSDLYLRDGRKPFHSVNFLTSHDGFTLNDLVSFNGKHNDENGENNHDGSDNNVSFNYGFEGPSVNKKIENIRTRQIKNFFLTLLISQGTPMILGGDEFRRTQNGNNNAYCQDNEMSWFDWHLAEKNRDIFRFVKRLIEFRMAHPAFRRPEFFEGQDHSCNMLPDIVWYDENGKIPDWNKVNHFVAFALDGSHAEIFHDIDDNDFYLMFNAAHHDISVKIPPAPAARKWYCAIDTAAEPPNDIPLPGSEEILPYQNIFVLQARSAAVLISR